MRGENMLKTRLRCCQIATRTLNTNTMVRAVFRPETELTLFLRFRTKEIAKA